MASCVSKNQVKLDREYPLNEIIYYPDGAILREKCSDQSKKITIISKGETFTILERSSKDFLIGISDFWYKGIYRGLNGCVFGGYIRKSIKTVPFQDTLKLRNLRNRILSGNNIDIEYVEEMDEKYPNNGYTKVLKSRLSLSKSDFTQCILDANLGIQLGTFLEENYFQRGVCLLNLEDKEKGIDDLIYSYNISLIKSKLLPSFICRKMGEMKKSEGIKYCNITIKDFPDYPDGYKARSEFYAQMGQNAESLLDIIKYKSLLSKEKGE